MTEEKINEEIENKYGMPMQQGNIGMRNNPYLKAKKSEKTLTQTQTEITEVMNELRVLLINKNEQYGDSVLEPIRIFSKASIDEQVKVRIDDKINRLLQGDDSLESDEDVIKDLIGYLVLFLLHMRRN
tara:strand:+ start:138 stop:521 length:384 start_codon:yes stop_codon:yes gene_type:complete